MYGFTSETQHSICVQSKGCCSQYVNLNSRHQNGNASTQRAQSWCATPRGCFWPSYLYIPQGTHAFHPHTLVNQSYYEILQSWSNPSVKKVFEILISLNGILLLLHNKEKGYTKWWKTIKKCESGCDSGDSTFTRFKKILEKCNFGSYGTLSPQIYARVLMKLLPESNAGVRRGESGPSVQEIQDPTIFVECGTLHDLTKALGNTQKQL